jgi:hypothetical protein
MGCHDSTKPIRMARGGAGTQRRYLVFC